jgi:hypothetical protein
LETYKEVFHIFIEFGRARIHAQGSPGSTGPNDQEHDRENANNNHYLLHGFG